MIRSNSEPISHSDIRVRGLRKYFDAAEPAAGSAKVLKVIDDLSLNINKGEIVALTGRSGCGKTTLLHCLAGLLAPDGGEISPVELPRHCAVVFQDCRLLPWASLEKNLMLALQSRTDLPKSVKQKRVAGMHKELGLSRFAATKASLLSGGMAQRAALGRALLQEPVLLLMDEPFASLDALTRRDMQDMLLSLHAQKIQTILFVTHDLTEAVQLADRVLVMASGRIRADCRIAATKPRDPENRDILDIRRHLRRLVMSLPDIPSSQPGS